MLNFNVKPTFTPRALIPDRKVMLYERRVKVKLDLTLQQPFTNVVITLCASWGAGLFLWASGDANQLFFYVVLTLLSFLLFE